MRFKRTPFLLLIFIFGVLVSGCNKLIPEQFRRVTPPPPGIERNTGEIRMLDSGFVPTEVRAKPNSLINIINNGSIPHSVTSDTGTFDSGLIEAGQPIDMEGPSEPGSYPFHCSIHPEIKGVLTIE
ncbi:MAG: Metal-binding protein [Candidatus Collierbacteria bacterium GW2011_GWC2_45_15]|uniref:Metal-binding protein n=1 Tax=Candidatus Collierbacteria bacterium GW2011_GWC2_45_15 TaxID=1618394 RepID=A0A0G1NV24_9BACT|nr:MAG: Metal-binding protein [Candidatus Collierbacteria bacterium GW2011_GWC2_45_15]